MIKISHLLETARYAAIEAGKVIMEVYHRPEFSTKLKKDNTPSTQADRRAHTIITGFLKKTNLPVLSEEGMNIDYVERKSWDYFWLIDPLDGTREFLNKNGEFTVDIALMHENIPLAGIIYVPCTDTMYYGSKQTGIYKHKEGNRSQILPLKERVEYDQLVRKEQLVVVISRSHSSISTNSFTGQLKNVTLRYIGSSLKFMILLENLADIYPRFGSTMEWDTAAAHALLNASNRGVYNTDLKSELTYNKPDLINPAFIAF